MLSSYILLILGFALLISGANGLVNGATGLARKYGISDLTIGLTIVAFGTSAPELVVSSIASIEGHQDIIMGNVIGSNIFNLFVILGLSGLITPLVVQHSTVWKEIPFSFLAVVLLYFLSNDLFFSPEDTKALTFMDGIILLSLFGLFLLYLRKQLQKDKPERSNPSTEASPIKIWFSIILGLAGLILGGSLVVNNAIGVARYFEVSEKIIALTIVAAGTSLPELATSIVAAFKKRTSLVIKPFNFNQSFNLDICFLGLGTIFLFIAMFSGRKRKLDRWEAALLLVAYPIYLMFQ
jgi:cation:H+ antiporter